MPGNQEVVPLEPLEEEVKTQQNNTPSLPQFLQSEAQVDEELELLLQLTIAESLEEKRQTKQIASPEDQEKILIEPQTTSHEEVPIVNTLEEVKTQQDHSTHLAQFIQPEAQVDDDIDEQLLQHIIQESLDEENRRKRQKIAP